MDYKYVKVESFDDGAIVRIMMNRPNERNAQNRGLLVELDDAFLKAEADDKVKVIIFGGEGPHFSAGHDMGTPESIAERTPGPDQHPTTLGYGGTYLGTEKRMRQEWHFFYQNTLRWRNLRKITIAQVQGKCYAAALMLAWACDLIVASEDAEFADVVGTRLGMQAVEYFAHPWEFGHRKAKELLLTSDAIDANEAQRLGMVNKVFPRESLEDKTLEFARRISMLPTATSLWIKESVNQTQEAQGFLTGLQMAFSLHQINHAHWAEARAEVGPDGEGAKAAAVDWRTAGAVKLVNPNEP